MKKRLFDLFFKPEMQPGGEQRMNAPSLDAFMGSGRIESEPVRREPGTFREHGLREKFKSNQIAQLLPSRIRKV